MAPNTGRQSIQQNHGFCTSRSTRTRHRPNSSKVFRSLIFATRMDLADLNGLTLLEVVVFAMAHLKMHYSTTRKTSNLTMPETCLSPTTGTTVSAWFQQTTLLLLLPDSLAARGTKMGGLWNQSFLTHGESPLMSKETYTLLIGVMHGFAN